MSFLTSLGPQALNQKLPASAAFGPWELLDAVSRDRQELGLIIDLTFTSRYYGPQVRTGLQGSGLSEPEPAGS